MSENRLFPFLILLHPTEQEAQRGEKTKTLVDHQSVTATSRMFAVGWASDFIPVAYRDQLEQIEVRLPDEEGYWKTGKKAVEYKQLAIGQNELKDYIRTSYEPAQ